MKIHIGKEITVINIEEDNTSINELNIIAQDLKVAIGGLNALVSQLSDIVITQFSEKIEVLQEAITNITQISQNSFQSIVVNNYNQYITQPCPPGESGKEGEKKDEDKSPFELFKEIFEDLKGIKDLYDKLKHAYKIMEGIVEKDWEEVGEQIGEVIEDVLKDDVVEMVGEVFGEIVEVAAELVLAADPIVWAAAAIAAVGVAAYEIYKNSQNNTEQPQNDNPQSNNPLFQQPKISPAMPPGSFQTQPQQPILRTSPEGYPLRSFSGPQDGASGDGKTYTIPPPAGQPPLGAYSSGSNGLNSGGGNGAGQGGNSNFNTQSPNTVNSSGSGAGTGNGTGEGNGTGAGNGTGNGGGGNMGTPCPPMPCLCEEIMECLKMNNPQAMPVSPTYPGMNMSYSNMTVTYNYNFGSVASFQGMQSNVTGTAGGNFQAQFIEVLTQAVQDAKVGADVH